MPIYAYWASVSASVRKCYNTRHDEYTAALKIVHMAEAQSMPPPSVYHSGISERELMNATALSFVVCLALGVMVLRNTEILWSWAERCLEQSRIVAGLPRHYRRAQDDAASSSPVKRAASISHVKHGERQSYATASKVRTTAKRGHSRERAREQQAAELTQVVGRGALADEELGMADEWPSSSAQHGTAQCHADSPHAHRASSARRNSSRWARRRCVHWSVELTHLSVYDGVADACEESSSTSKWRRRKPQSPYKRRRPRPAGYFFDPGPPVTPLYGPIPPTPPSHHLEVEEDDDEAEAKREETVVRKETARGESDIGERRDVTQSMQGRDLPSDYNVGLSRGAGTRSWVESQLTLMSQGGSSMVMGPDSSTPAHSRQPAIDPENHRTCSRTCGPQVGSRPSSTSAPSRYSTSHSTSDASQHVETTGRHHMSCTRSARFTFAHVDDLD